MEDKKEPTYWEKRKLDYDNVVGRPKAFRDPAELWLVACEYFQRCNENPWIKTDYKGKDADKVEIPVQCPYLWSGLDDYCFEKGHCVSLKDYRTASRNPDYRDGMYREFAEVITRIDEIMKTQKISGAMVGAFNANLVARLEGLAEKTESEVTVKETRVGFE